MDKRQHRNITWREQPDILLKSNNINEQGGVVQTTHQMGQLLTEKSTHKALKRSGGNWGKPAKWEQTLSHRKFRRKRIEI